MNILLYMLKRTIYNIPVVLLLTIFVFAMVRFLPGDPADILLSGKGGRRPDSQGHPDEGIGIG